MHVVITQNRDKQINVINGQIRKIHTMHNSTIILELSNGKLVSVYPVTIQHGPSVVTLYPLCSAYANTMCKAQGQTLAKAALWFDMEKIHLGQHMSLYHVSKN